MKVGMKTLCVMALCGLLIMVVSGCGAQSVQEEQEHQENLRYMTVISRFDSQRDVYDFLARSMEDYLAGDRAVEEEKFRSFCLGVYCYAGNDPGAYTSLYPEDIAEILKGLIEITVKNNMDQLHLSDLTDDELKQLMADFEELADCCHRGKEGTFAYYVGTGDLESDLFQAERKRVEKLLLSVDELTNVE